MRARVCVFYWVDFFLFICWSSLYILDTHPLLYVVPFFLPSLLLLFFFHSVLFFFLYPLTWFCFMKYLGEGRKMLPYWLSTPPRQLRTSVSVSVWKPKIPLGVASWDGKGRIPFPSSHLLHLSLSMCLSSLQQLWQNTTIRWLKTTEMDFVPILEARSLNQGIRRIVLPWGLWGTLCPCLAPEWWWLPATPGIPWLVHTSLWLPPLSWHGLPFCVTLCLPQRTIGGHPLLGFGPTLNSGKTSYRDP